MPTQRRLKAMQITIMCENPVTPPQFAHKWMRIFKGDFALCGFTDMCNHIAGFNRIVANQVSNRRLNRGLIIDK
jgi:hypothetical protein